MKIRKLKAPSVTETSPRNEHLTEGQQLAKVLNVHLNCAHCSSKDIQRRPRGFWHCFDCGLTWKYELCRPIIQCINPECRSTNVVRQKNGFYMKCITCGLFWRFENGIPKEQLQP